jgi:hypothetical protein
MCERVAPTTAPRPNIKGGVFCCVRTTVARIQQLAQAIGTGDPLVASIIGSGYRFRVSIGFVLQAHWLRAGMFNAASLSYVLLALIMRSSLGVPLLRSLL